MVDNLSTAQSPEADDSAKQGKRGAGGFLGTMTGRIVIGVVVLVVVLAAVGVVFMTSLVSRVAEESGVTVPPAGSITATGSAGAGGVQSAPAYRRSKPLTTVFVFRDIFEPTAKAVKPQTDGSGSPTDTAGGGTDGDGVPDNLPADTLFVKSIQIVDGEPVATFIWNGTEYTAGEGETLEGTPWRVVSISGNTVVLLYGDSRVTLTVGQGLTK